MSIKPIKLPDDTEDPNTALRMALSHMVAEVDALPLTNKVQISQCQIILEQMLEIHGTSAELAIMISNMRLCIDANERKPK